jgi:hypothetical protein
MVPMPADVVAEHGRELDNQVALVYSALVPIIAAGTSIIGGKIPAMSLVVPPDTPTDVLLHGLRAARTDVSHPFNRESFQNFRALPTFWS